MPRKSTGKRTRFEVFKRDGFACVYCGAQPPAVVLVIDHAVAVAAGGTEDISNLVTSCEPCNQGKADKPLTVRAVRPDADLLYLEAQQEAAELRRYQAALEEKEEQSFHVVCDLQDLWKRLGGTDWVPAEHIIRQMMAKYEPSAVEMAIRDVAPKVGTGYIKDGYWRYMWAFLRNRATETEPEPQDGQDDIPAMADVHRSVVIRRCPFGENFDPEFLVFVFDKRAEKDPFVGPGLCDDPETCTDCAQCEAEHRAWDAWLDATGVSTVRFICERMLHLMDESQ